MLLADVSGVLILLLAVPILRWAALPVLVAFALGRKVERVKRAG